jgi:hypothetical protein
MHAACGIDRHAFSPDIGPQLFGLQTFFVKIS